MGSSHWTCYDSIDHSIISLFIVTLQLEKHTYAIGLAWALLFSFYSLITKNVVEFHRKFLIHNNLQSLQFPLFYFAQSIKMISMMTFVCWSVVGMEWVNLSNALLSMIMAANAYFTSKTRKCVSARRQYRHWFCGDIGGRCSRLISTFYAVSNQFASVLCCRIENYDGLNDKWRIFVATEHTQREIEHAQSHSDHHGNIMEIKNTNKMLFMPLETLTVRFLMTIVKFGMT